MIYTKDGVEYHFYDPYRLTTLAGVDFYEDGMLIFHPLFHENIRGAGYKLDNMEDMVTFLNAVKKNILGSQYCDYLVDTLTLHNVLRYDPERGFYGLNGYQEVPLVPIDSRDDASVCVLLSHLDGSNSKMVIRSGSGLFAENEDCFYPTFGAVAVFELDDVPSDHQSVKNYSYRPEFKTMRHHRDRPDEPLLFGMELEVSTRLSAKELQYIVTKVEPKQEYFFFFKSDSSISGSMRNKYEIVTHPMTPRRMKQEWKTLFKKLQDLCTRKDMCLSDVFDTSSNLTNGLHIHVNKQAFIQHTYRDKGHVNRFLTAFNQWNKGYLDFLQSISLRPEPIHQNRYCKVHPGFDGYKLARRISKGCRDSHDRHSMAHETDYTVEVRVFYGLVDLQHILSCIDIVRAMFEYSYNVPLSQFDKPSFVENFKEWVMKSNRFRHAKEVIIACA